MASQEEHDSLIPRREELLQALAVGAGLAAQAMDAFGGVLRRAARVLEELAESLAEPDPEPEPPVAPTGPTGATGPTGPTLPRGPLDPPVNP